MSAPLIGLAMEGKNEDGFTSLPIVLAVMIMLSVLGTAVLFAVDGDVVGTRHEDRSSKALYVAESGLNNYLWKLNQDENYYKTTVDPAQQDWTPFDNGYYFLNVSETTGVPGVIVESRAEVRSSTGASVSRTVRARVQKKSFTRYLYLTNYETFEGTGQSIWFITGDRIRGPLHSNDRININGSPVFEGKVTTSRTINKTSGAPVYMQGYEENVAPMEMPSSNQELKAWAQAGGYYYYGMTTIRMAAGGLQVTNDNALSTGPTGSVSLPGNGVIYVDGQAGLKYSSSNGDAFVQGSLGGELTIGAKNNIYITADILYDDPETDMLGLVAENYVLINHRDQNGQDVAPTDIEVNAAIFALNHSFGFEDYTKNLKGTLTVNGAIIQRYRGPVGTFSGSTRVSGYAKNYWYNERMLYYQPPHFLEPLNSGFEVVDWDER